MYKNNVSRQSPYLCAGKKTKVNTNQKNQKNPRQKNPKTNQDPLKMQYLICLNFKTEGAEICICAFNPPKKPSCMARMTHF